VTASGSVRARHAVSAKAEGTGSAWRPRPRAVVLAFILIVLGEVAAWFLLRSQGNDFGGDQAHYLIAGQALSHLSLHPLPQYGRDFVTHFVYRWPAGASITDHTIVQTFPGPHGSVFNHGIGLPLLLSPFIVLGSVPGGLLGLFAITALGLVCLHQRASLLTGLGRLGQLVFALALAGPAIWVASTQVYPDLVSGVLLAVALVEIALIERDRRVGRFGAVVIAVTLAFVPWLQIKNLAPALCACAALALIAFTLPAPRRRLLAVAVVVVLGWLLLFAYNQHYFGHLVGLPQPNPTFTLGSAARVLALVFDRHQGLLVQVPTVLIGGAGLWVARRTIPWTVLAAAAGVLAMLVINGTYTSDVPFGGAALAGRFEWTVVPMVLAWCPFALARLERVRVRLLGLAGAIGVLWLVEGIPVLVGNHTYVNATIAPFAPWDPTLYPGWWPGLGQSLPEFLPPGLHAGATWTHLLFEVLLVAAAVLVLGRLLAPGPIRFGPLAATLAAVALAAGLMAAVGPAQDRPQSSLSWTGADLGAPWSSGDSPTTFPPVELVDVGSGTYRATLVYATDPGTPPAKASLLVTPVERSVTAHWLTLAHPTDAALLSVTAPTLDTSDPHYRTVTLRPPGPSSAAHRTVSIEITSHRAAVLSFVVQVSPGASYGATSLTLTKLSS
jgi:hypothetical protein